MVVLVRVAGENVVNAGADHFQEGVLAQVRVAWAVENSGKSCRQPEFVRRTGGWVTARRRWKARPARVRSRGADQRKIQAVLPVSL